MAMHKMVNGKKVDLTPEEEVSIKEEWERNRLINEKKKVERQKEIERKNNLKESAKKKLESLGLTLEELSEIIK